MCCYCRKKNVYSHWSGDVTWRFPTQQRLHDGERWQVLTTCSMYILLKLTRVFHWNNENNAIIFKSKLQQIWFQKPDGWGFEGMRLALSEALIFYFVVKRGLNLIPLYYDGPFVRHSQVDVRRYFCSFGLSGCLFQELALPHVPLTENMTPINIRVIIQTRRLFFSFFFSFSLLAWRMRHYVQSHHKCSSTTNVIFRPQWSIVWGKWCRFGLCVMVWVETVWLNTCCVCLRLWDVNKLRVRESKSA